MHTLGERESGKPDREFESRPFRFVREKMESRLLRYDNLLSAQSE